MKKFPILFLAVLLAILLFGTRWLFSAGKLINPLNIKQAIDFTKIGHDSNDKIDRYTQEQYIGFIVKSIAIQRKDYSNDWTSEYNLKLLGLKRNEIAYTLFDLNNDDEPEVLYTFLNNGWCGTAGCHFGILQLDKDRDIKILKENNIYQNAPVLILTSKTQGYNDIYAYTKTKHNLMKFNSKKHFYIYK